MLAAKQVAVGGLSSDRGTNLPAPSGPGWAAEGHEAERGGRGGDGVRRRHQRRRRRLAH